MIFYAKSKHGTIITDDYDDEEIKNKKHILNLAYDFIKCYPNASPFVVIVRDEKDVIVSKFVIGNNDVAWLTDFDD